MNVSEFVKKWSSSNVRERQGSQTHFNDLCKLLELDDPVTADPKGEWFVFDKANQKKSGKLGFADVWRKKYFAWEYKGKNDDLEKALDQLSKYSNSLENPPLLIVSDMDKINIHTRFENNVNSEIKVDLENIHNNIKTLKDCFLNPQNLRSKKLISELTEEAAKTFISLLKQFSKNHHQSKINNFLMQLLFTFFCENVNLIQQRLLSELIKKYCKDPVNLKERIKKLFLAMKNGGFFGQHEIKYFNGGLFSNVDIPNLNIDSCNILLNATKYDWSNIDPSIFGTLFEQGLEISLRKKLKAYYTEPGLIKKLIDPVVLKPLSNEWDEIKNKLDKLDIRYNKAKTKRTEKILQEEIESHVYSFKNKLQNYKILDPACGSGNFLYLSLIMLKDFESKVNNECRNYRISTMYSEVSPINFYGYEINSYATELAKTTLVIGELQWLINNGYNVSGNPVLKNLNNIKNVDSLMDNEKIRIWDKVDCIIGNPPYAGDKKIKKDLGEEYVGKLRGLYKGLIDNSSDYCMYWMLKSSKQLKNGNVKYVGLVNYNGTRQGVNLKEYKKAYRQLNIYSAHTDIPWPNKGASIRVCIISYCSKKNKYINNKYLNGKLENDILYNLTSNKKLFNDSDELNIIDSNKKIMFQPPGTAGKFVIDQKTAKKFINEKNKSGFDNKGIIKFRINGEFLLKKFSNKFIIDFENYDYEYAKKFEKPFQYVVDNVKPVRDLNNHPWRRENFWKLSIPAIEFRKKLQQFDNYIAVSRVAKHLIFNYLPKNHFPDSRLFVIFSDCPVIFGILSSKLHKVWFNSLRHLHAGERPTYHKKIFETFPFPEYFKPNYSNNQKSKSSLYIDLKNAAINFIRTREELKYPSDLYSFKPNIADIYPEIPLLKSKKRMSMNLTEIYNSDLLNALQNELDEIVMESYNLKYNITDEEILENLIYLNKNKD